MDWRDIIKSIAPTIYKALNGPLVGTAVKVLSDVVLGDSNANPDKLQEVVLSGLNPDVLLKLKEADNDFSIKMESMKIDLKKLEFSEKSLYVSDTQDARKYKDSKVFWLGVVILVTFASVTVVTLYASYALLTGSISLKDPSVVGMISGFVGTILGYVAANAQQVVGFFFGSSSGSDKKTEALSNAFVDMTSKIK